MNTTIEPEVSTVELSTSAYLTFDEILHMLANDIGTTPERKRILLEQLNTPKIRVSFL